MRDEVCRIGRVRSTSEGKTVKCSYDSAGRLVKEGNLVYTYKGLDKLTEVTENGKVTGSYTYYAGGQLASAIDWQGANIYQIPDKEGAEGAGHSAWITHPKALLENFAPLIIIPKEVKEQEFNLLIPLRTL